MQSMTGNPTTASSSTTQEVLLRTLASDIASLQHGSQTPTPQQYTAQFAVSGEDHQKGAHDAGRVIRLMLALIFLAAIGVAIYYFVYPSFVEAQP